MRPLPCTVVAVALFLSPILAHEGEPPEGAMERTRMPNVKMPRMHQAAGSTLACSIHAMLPALGHPDWSTSRVVALIGYPFHFEMREDGGRIFNDNLDWRPIGMEHLETLGQVRVFNATKDSSRAVLSALKEDARDAVVASLEKGVPGLVWQPMSREQKGKVHGFCWGLIVGYNEEDETYVIRHAAEELDYPVRFDAIGHTDPIEWFRIGIFEPKDLDDRALHLTALRNAVASGVGTRLENPPRPYGFDAYELWQNVFESADVPLDHSHRHAEVLEIRRKAAVSYLRELIDTFPDAAAPLEAAAAHYERELESLASLHDICHAAASTEAKAFTDDQRTEARRLIAKALNYDRQAVEQIEAALKVLEAS